MALSNLLVIGALLELTGYAAHHKPQIAFTSGRDGNTEIYVMDADGKNQRNLTNHPTGDSQPSWSPDGEMIAYESWRGPDLISEIHLRTSDGKYLKQLSGVHERGDWDPDWLDPSSLNVAAEGNRITIWGRLKKLAPDIR